jgi:hypothetical protein
MVKERLAAWALRHAYGDLVNAGTKGGGRLLYVDEEGAVRDLGVYAVRELEGMAWAVGVAYRTSPVRYDRVRLAAIRGAAHRLAVALRK